MACQVGNNKIVLAFTGGNIEVSLDMPRHVVILAIEL
ncbi:hypothetical protein NIES4071_102990 (plasmid) [Calothrix sp. NIES-4071]|nr:hypothetical protein NIES4071_102990 [Calothrix sp. NIES-4071]BAZ64680.1 hypothetical protein NIES4105_104130 [Calothrix sp. NIES-4105]